MLSTTLGRDLMNESASSSDPAAEALKDRIRVALVCQSNVNRSMEAHAILQENGYKADSFGAGSKVKLPGERANKPNVYDFGTPYNFIYNDLFRKNQAHYTRNKILPMIERNKKVKKAPERFQDCTQRFDIVIAYEQRIFDILVNQLHKVCLFPWNPRNTLGLSRCGETYADHLIP